MQRNLVFRSPTSEELNCSIPEPLPDYQMDDDDENDEMSDSLPPPPPPITADELSAAVSAAYDASQAKNNPVAVEGSNPRSQSDEEPPLIAPKPLHNPCVESKERQALHKELLLNQRLGKDVLQKSELNKVLRDRKATQRKKEWEEIEHTKGRTSLEMKLEERANRIKQEEAKEMQIIKEDTEAPELVRMHRKITLKPGRDASVQS